MASANNAFKSHEDFRRARDLEEARKAGLAPAAVDEDGKEINPHIPQYMANAPWYLASDAPSLKHQRDWRAGSGGKDRLDAGVRRPAGGAAAAAAARATTFRKGACENCGAMTHKAKDCLERPRARGAKLTGKHIAPDEDLGGGGGGGAGPSGSGAGAGPPAAPAASLSSYAARRDRWRGYDPAEYDKVVDLYDKVEAAKKEMAKAAELEARFAGGRVKKGKAAAEGGDGGGGGEASSSEEDDDDGADPAGAAAAATAAAAAAAAAPGGGGGGGDEDRVGDTAAAAFAAVEKRVRTPGGGASGSVRNLRIREDTAKYLLNLDVDSAYYDPKSRSMRQDPRPDLPAAAKAFAGDNFVRTAGPEYAAWAALEAHAARAAGAGAEGVHATAVPSQAAALHAAFKARKAALGATAAVAVQGRYGNAAAAPDPALAPLLTAQTEAYVEYDPATGRALPGKGGAGGGGAGGAAPAARSRYEEDVHPGNHTSVWGSWWSGGAWGYACCHATLRGAHCLGAAGREAAAAAAAQMAANLEAAAGRRAAAATAAAAAAAAEGGTAAATAAAASRRPPGSAAAWGPDAAGGAGAGGEPELDREALAAALAAEDARLAAGGAASAGGKRSLGEGAAAAPTAEEVEAYRLKRQRGEDPMAKGKAGGQQQQAGGYDFV